MNNNEEIKILEDNINALNNLRKSIYNKENIFSSNIPIPDIEYINKYLMKRIDDLSININKLKK